MESWHLPYDTVMQMPTTRRYRMILKKADLERRREEYHKNSMK